MSADDDLQSAIAENAPIAIIQETAGEGQESQDDLPTLIAEATAAYSKKHYRDAAELYSRATELQAEQNGEMSPENADLLFLYGRCLYKVAIEKSDVLGEKVAGEKPQAKTGQKVDTNGKSTEKKTTKDDTTAATAGPAGNPVDGEAKTTSAKPFFQITGDENFDDSDDEDEAGNANDQEEEEDEFMNAFEILDLARVLLQRKLEQLESSTADQDGDDSHRKNIIQVKERLVDTYDLQGEISLENENFPAAANDIRAAIAIKADLDPPDSAYLAELHYKLSLALEFASVIQPRDANGEIDQNQLPTVDKPIRKEAISEMEIAIASCKARIEKEELALKEGKEMQQSGRKEKVTQKSINDVKEMVAEMELKLVDFKQPPVTLSGIQGSNALDGNLPLNGILGAMLGSTAEQQKAALEEASKSAKDITGLVRKKKPASESGAASTSAGASSSASAATAATTAAGNGEMKHGTKRKVEFAADVDDIGAAENGKKARVEDEN